MLAPAMPITPGAACPSSDLCGVWILDDLHQAVQVRHFGLYVWGFGCKYGGEDLYRYFYSSNLHGKVHGDTHHAVLWFPLRTHASVAASDASLFYTYACAA